MARQGNDLLLGYPAKNRPVILPHDLRLHHLSIVGLTGTGKSRYLEWLIRQDIRLWPITECGLVVVDPHGELFDSIMQWVAASGLTHLPIVPIDLRRREQVVSYNVLRQRPGEPSVIIDNFVKAMAYAWGQAGTDETPLFERWATNTLYRLYHERKTLADAAHLFTPEGMVIVDEIDDLMIRRDWIWARRNLKDFEIATSSSINRFRRFLLNPTLRAIFGQSDVSFDFGQALEKGQIVLVSLARNGGNVSRENADLFATLLMADLWTAADERGKGSGVKPFYVFLDEFQRFMTPTMAENLAEARGFGLGMHLANQFPRQILNGGQHGPRIYDEVMENARSKVIFRLRTRANLEAVAESLFIDTIDPEQVKYQHESTKVLGHHLMYLPSFGVSSTQTSGGGRQQSQSTGRNHSRGTNWSHSESESHTSTNSWADTSGYSEATGSEWNEGTSVEEPSSINGLRRENNSSGYGESEGSTFSESHTEGGSETDAFSASDSFGGSETFGTSEGESIGTNTLWSLARGISTTLSPMLYPQLGKEADQPLFRSIEEQIFIAMTKIARLKDREAYVLAGDMSVPMLVRTPDVPRKGFSKACGEICIDYYQSKCGLALDFQEALRRVLDRDRTFGAVGVSGGGEFERPRRRLIAKVEPSPPRNENDRDILDQ